jgi:hypothetical protein
MSVLLGLISTKEKETGKWIKKSLIERLQAEFDILSGEAERLISQMLKEGTLFAPT